MTLIKNFTVGPSQHYHGVQDFLCKIVSEGYGEISHRSEKFTEISKQVQKSMREFFNIPDDYQIFYTYSATEGMEILTRNLVLKKAYHVISGNFGHVWKKTALKAQKEISFIENKNSERVQISEINPQDADFIALTGNETSTGLAFHPDEIQEIRKKFPNLMIGVDITSGMGAVNYDFMSADAWFFSVQKALGMPAGLGIVIMNQKAQTKALEKEKNGDDVGCHHCISGLLKKMEGKFQTPTTPNFLNIATIGFVTEQLKKDFGNISVLYRETCKKADFLKESFKNLTGLVQVSNSKSIFVLEGTEEKIIQTHEKLAKFGIKIGGGYGPKKKFQIRISNFPVHSMEDMENLMEVLQN